MNEQKTYTLFWLTGKSELVKGNDPAQAMTLAGYSNGAVRALDFFGEGDIRNHWEWNRDQHQWRSVKEVTA